MTKTSTITPSRPGRVLSGTRSTARSFEPVGSSFRRTLHVQRIHKHVARFRTQTGGKGSFERKQISIFFLYRKNSFWEFMKIRVFATGHKFYPSQQIRSEHRFTADSRNYFSPSHRGRRMVCGGVSAEGTYRGGDGRVVDQGRRIKGVCWRRRRRVSRRRRLPRDPLASATRRSVRCLRHLPSVAFSARDDGLSSKRRFRYRTIARVGDVVDLTAYRGKTDLRKTRVRKAFPGQTGPVYERFR